MMEEKLVRLTDQMAKLQQTTSVLETELHKKDAVIESYCKEMQVLKSQNDQLCTKLSTVQKMHKGR